MISRHGLLLSIGMAVASGAFGQISITSPTSLPEGYSTIPYTYTFVAYVFPANTPYTWSLPAGSTLPAGINLYPNGTLAGTTNQYGTFSFQVTATAGGFSDTEPFTLVLANPYITISSPSYLSNGFVGQNYLYPLVGSSNPAGLIWSLAPGSQLPPGLNLSTAGVISGNPTVGGVYTFTITDQIAGTTITDSQLFTLTVYGGQTSIQTTSLPFAVSGMPYQTILLGNPAGVSWVLTGTVPPGLTFNSTTGVFSGTTTILGVYPLQIQATFANYLSVTRAFNLYVTTGPLSLQSPLAPAVQGSPYQAQVGASGGLPPYQFSFPAVNPQGLSITSNGVITGTPFVPTGTYYVPVTVSDATGTSLTQTLTLFIANPLTVSTTSLPNASPGVPYLQSLLQGGGVSPYTWLVVQGSGSLPPGLSLSSSGVISGTPSGAGTYHFTVQVTDAGGRTATGPLSLSLAVAPLAISTSSLPIGEITIPYSQTVTATGGVAPYSWTIVSGAFPGGLSISPSGVISGTPSGPLGIASFALQVTDSSPPPAQVVQKAFTINITLSLTVTSVPLPGGIVGVPYSQTLAGSGGTTPYHWSISSGTLPPGLQLNAASGVISGTPTSNGPNVFFVTLTDATGLTAQQQQNISIVPPLSISTGNLSAPYNTPYTQALTATGGAPPYTWSISAGALPVGLQLTNGVINGTATAPGTSSVTFKVTDSQQLTATQSITVTVGLPATPTVTIGAINGAPATQPAVSLTLGSSFPAAITGTLSASFQSAVGGNPTEVQFVSSSGASSSVSFSIAAGSTNAVFTGNPVLATGTVAGTITLTASLNSGGVNITPSPAPTQTITIAPSAPVIQSVSFSNTGGSLSVTVIGYSTTREMVSGQYTFAPATGSSLSQNTVTAQLSSAFATWYQSSASNQFGGQFMLTMPFSVSGTATDVSSVSVTLTNTKGTSSAASPQ